MLSVIRNVAFIMMAFGSPESAFEMAREEERKSSHRTCTEYLFHDAGFRWLFHSPVQFDAVIGKAPQCFAKKSNAKFFALPEDKTLLYLASAVRRDCNEQGERTKIGSFFAGAPDFGMKKVVADERLSE